MDAGVLVEQVAWTQTKGRNPDSLEVLCPPLIMRVMMTKKMINASIAEQSTYILPAGLDNNPDRCLGHWGSVTCSRLPC